MGAALALALAACTGVPEGVSPVRFDPDRYLGTWYEIARLDHRFQRGDVAATATYALNPDGTIAVTNRGWRPDGTERSVTGRARFLGPRDVASLAVTFRWPFEGGYHVIRLDPDYRIALVSGPTRDYLWLLSRTPTLPEAGGAGVARLCGCARLPRRAHHPLAAASRLRARACRGAGEAA
ncbi:MAG: lipocalin family protein [Acetobacteraceae bacterium]|nr:lipocalin family protein [Acetobacteraceae bacterium]